MPQRQPHEAQAAAQVSDRAWWGGRGRAAINGLAGGSTMSRLK
jgi:hypothetical protein